MEARMGDDLESASDVGIVDEEGMVTTSLAHFGTARHVEERPAEENLEGSVLDDLKLELNDDFAETDRIILDDSDGESGLRVGSFHLHDLVRGERDV